MSLKETINQKFIEAFKTRDPMLKYPYEMMKQRIMMAEKSGQYELPLTDEQITNLIVKEYKEREELLKLYEPEDEQYRLSNYTLMELSQYLPKQMSEEDVIAIINRLKEIEANTGKLIGLVVKEVGNRFDKAKIAGLVKQVCQK
jgi:uncharacterized protein YqeY